MIGVAERLVGRAGRHDLARERARELVRDERRRRLPGVTGGRRRDGEARRRHEPALEPTPGEPCRVQLVADVRALERHGVTRRAVVPVRLSVAGEREAAEAVRRDVGIRSSRGRDRRTVRLVRGVDPAGVAGGDVDRARGGRPERGAERVVAHRVVLGVVPERGHRVAVVVVHDDLRIAERSARGRPAARVVRSAVRADALDELVHQAVVERLLLVAVVVVLVAGDLAARVARKPDRARVQPPRRREVRVVREQRGRQSVDRGRSRRRRKRRAVGVGRLWIRAEVVIEGDVLLEDHDEMLDRRGGPDTALPRRCRRADHAGNDCERGKCEHGAAYACAQHGSPSLSMNDRAESFNGGPSRGLPVGV